MFWAVETWPFPSSPEKKKKNPQSVFLSLTAGTLEDKITFHQFKGLDFLFLIDWIINTVQGTFSGLYVPLIRAPNNPILRRGTTGTERLRNLPLGMTGIYLQEQRLEPRGAPRPTLGPAFDWLPL